MSTNTSWMWPDSHGGVNGASIDKQDRTVLWFDSAAGCGCVGSFAEQSYEDFVQDGPILHNLPEDTLQELQQTVQAFLDQS